MQQSTAPSGTCSSGRRLRVTVAFLFAACALLRLGLVNRHGLWADELFSLAMATGHSLEHPADRADPALGDYLEAPRPVLPSAYSRYLEHDIPAAGPGRVVRATLRSDTGPPLYYLLLYGWTRVLGTNDIVLRLFSVVSALACFPVISSLAWQVGGKSASLPTCLLFTFSPLSVFYSTEGRTYALLWFWTVSTMWLTLRLWRGGVRPWPFLGWVGVGAAGLLTHYFFAFVWAAALAWLLAYPRRMSRKILLLGTALIGILVLPWYVRLPESLANWRVTGYWLYERPAGYDPVKALLYLPWSFFSIRGIWGTHPLFDWMNCALFVLLAVVIGWKLSWSLFSRRRRLLWFWLLSACLGLVAFDLLRRTYVLAVPRYAIAGMPAAFLLIGLGLGRLNSLTRTTFLLLIVPACLLGVGQMYRNASRSFMPTREVGQLLAGQTDASDLVIVHSIPSGVAGVARYMDNYGASAKGVGFASWVGQLKQRRVPEDLQQLAAGRRRIILVMIHEVGEPAVEAAWLEENATLVAECSIETATILYFVPRDADVFFSSGPSLTRR